MEIFGEHLHFSSHGNVCSITVLCRKPSFLDDSDSDIDNQALPCLIRSHEHRVASARSQDQGPIL